MSFRRPKLITPPYLDCGDDNYVYLIFSGHGDYPIQLLYTNNLVGIETNQHRAKQLALDIAAEEYKKTKNTNHNIIIRCEPGNIQVPFWSTINKKHTIGGCLANREGVKYLEKPNIRYKNKMLKRRASQCLIC